MEINKIINLNNLKEYFRIAAKSILTRRVRSWLTTIGIAIGVFLIVALISLSQGLKNAVLHQLSMVGKDLIIIMPGDITNVSSFMSGSKLSNLDLKIIRNTEGVQKLISMDYTSVTMRYFDTKKTILLYGADWRNSLDVFQNDVGWTLAQGRWPVPQKAEIVVGSLVASDTFPGMRVGTEAVINGRKFIVAGILNSVGSKQDDNMVGVDLPLFQNLTGERNGAKQAMAKIMSNYNADFVADKIKSNLNENRKRQIGQQENESSYTVLTSEKITSIVGNVLGLIQAVIIGFASIAIIVGGIGIMNTMYTSVRERVKEIGVMKAIGAKNRTITTIFLIESGIFGFLGGVIGTLLGIIFAKAVETYFQFHPFLYLRADVSLQLILFCLAFSFVVGCLSGYFPARAASKLKPVEALRYE
jgi:putative ABC transport system permease protein